LSQLGPFATNANINLSILMCRVCVAVIPSEPAWEVHRFFNHLE